MFQKIKKIIGKSDTRDEIENRFKKVALHILEKEIKTKVPSTFHDHAFSEVWPGIASFLREALNKERQEEFIRRLLKEGGFKNTDELAKFLTHVNAIPWFKPLSKPDTKTIASLVNDSIKRLDLNATEQDGGQWKHFEVDDIKVVENDWKAANDIERNLFRHTTINMVSSEINTIIRKHNNEEEHLSSLNILIWGMIWGQSEVGRSNTPVIAAAEIIESVAKWISLKDLMAKNGFRENPYQSLLALYELGLWPIGIVKDKSKHYFVVFNPPIDTVAKK